MVLAKDSRAAGWWWPSPAVLPGSPIQVKIPPALPTPPYSLSPPITSQVWSVAPHTLSPQTVSKPFRLGSRLASFRTTKYKKKQSKLIKLASFPFNKFFEFIGKIAIHWTKFHWTPILFVVVDTMATL